MSELHQFAPDDESDEDPRRAKFCPDCGVKYDLGRRKTTMLNGAETCTVCKAQATTKVFACGRCGRTFSTLDWKQPAARRDQHESDCNLAARLHPATGATRMAPSEPGRSASPRTMR